MKLDQNSRWTIGIIVTIVFLAIPSWIIAFRSIEDKIPVIVSTELEKKESSISLKHKYSYVFSKLELLEEGKYVRKLHLKYIGKDILYSEPLISFKFNTKIEEAITTSQNITYISSRSQKSKDVDEFFLHLHKVEPGHVSEFVFSNDKKFSIINFKLNNVEQFIPQQ